MSNEQPTDASSDEITPSDDSAPIDDNAPIDDSAPIDTEGELSGIEESPVEYDLVGALSVFADDDGGVDYHLPSVEGRNPVSDNIAEGLTDPGSSLAEMAQARYDELGRLELAILLARSPGLARTVAGVLWGVEALSARADSFQRYVRVKGKDIEDLARTIEDQLRGGDVEGARQAVRTNLEDLTGPIDYFAKKRGMGTSRIRMRARDDLALVRAVLEDLDER